ncbi:hypothetical protein BRADI_2g62596v3 [Brachypodium distachyon]|uniref:Uncharacterized protein n=1 Tax=Brachypodium distachyon TaxID=15368 RepID=A0A2K2DHF4_BRADI|nr:hypothetical protein BRADI_2g62596v3 [Brachypodium distachyon]
MARSSSSVAAAAVLPMLVLVLMMQHCCTLPAAAAEAAASSSGTVSGNKVRQAPPVLPTEPIPMPVPSSMATGMDSTPPLLLRHRLPTEPPQ